MKFGFWILILSTLASAAARADQAACDRIREENLKTQSSHVQMTVTGYAFAADTPDIYGSGTHTCSFLRDESVDGQPASVYREQYRSKTGSTDATIWISKSSGMLLREEQDGDVTGKGKGHIAYRWTPRTTVEPAPAGGASSKDNGKLPIYPRGRNLNDMPASVVAQGVPMVLETSDSVATVDAWYKSHVPGSCARTAASEGVKWACPAGSVVIYPHEGKTQIAFVPARSTSWGRQR
ncbi:MAG TPA: hypothetical protein VGK26_10390 [Thermoanaerobaculia bacterium]|jgi:hypothetical protein